jgi:hypothetical protein
MARSKKTEREKIARAAAQGVAIALAARTPLRLRVPFKIICGIPPDIFEATLKPTAGGGISVTSIVPQEMD